MNRLFFYLVFLFLAASAAQGQFLDFSQPARATALGGNLVAMPEGPSAMAFNPAGLGLQERFQATARYQDLFSGLENDSISTGNLSFETPLMDFGALGLSWDHLGANQLEQDNVRLGWGKDIDTRGILHSLEVGFSCSYLMQRFILSVPLQGVSPTNVAAGSVAFGAGVLISPWTDLTIGASADDINQPNLGVVGTDRVPATYRWGASFELFSHDPIRFNFVAGQSLLNSQLDNQGGLEIYFSDLGIRLRGGADNYQGSLGFGYEWSDFLIDYAYSFSAFGNEQVSGVGLPNSNLIELGLQWGGGPGSDYDGYMKKARFAENGKNWGWAAWYYQEALAAKPNDKNAQEGRKRNMPLYNLQRAQRFYVDGQKAEQANVPEDARFYYEMAVKLAPGENTFTAALERVKTNAIKISAQKFYQDGLAAQQRGALFEARSDLGMAAKLDPEQPDYAKALTAINQVFITRITDLTSEERGIDEFVTRVSHAISRGDRPAASKALAEGMKKYPHQPALELVEKMMGLWAKGGSEAPHNRAVQLLENEADLYLSKGRPDLAKASLQEALKTQPSNQSVKNKLEALESTTKTVSADKMAEAEALYEKGLQCYLAGDLDGAITAWQDALKADPDHTKAQNNLVRAKMERQSKTP